MSTVPYFPEDLFTFTKEILNVELLFLRCEQDYYIIICQRRSNKNLQHFYRSSRSQMFLEIGVFKDFANFTGKHLCWSLFLIKLQVWRAYDVRPGEPTMLLKRDSKTCVFL